nr:hypothetical protein HK105_005729 [Polyrhizophydium stewartii]
MALISDGQFSRLSDDEDGRHNGVIANEPISSTSPGSGHSLRDEGHHKNSQMELLSTQLNGVMATAPLDDHTLEIHELCQRYGTNFNQARPSLSRGLPAGEATERLQIFGPNIMTPPKRRHIFFKFLDCLAAVFNMMLIAAGLAEWILFFVNPRLVPAKCSVVRAGIVRLVAVSELVPGDVVYVRMGDKVPADMVVFAASDFKVDNSSLTGESEPQPRAPKNTIEGAGPLEATNMCFNGTLVVTGEAYGIVVRTGNNSVLGQIARMATAEPKAPSPLSIEISRFCRIITSVACLTSVFFFFYSLVTRRGFNNSLSFAVGVLVAWVPQGLNATVTMLLTISARRMAKQSVLVKDIEGVETLGAITMLATDKTGTLTRNQMRVSHLWVNGVLWSVESSEPEPADDSSRDSVRSSKGHRSSGTTSHRSSVVDLPSRTFDPHAHGMDDMLRNYVLCSNARFDRVDVPIPNRKIFADATESGLYFFAATHLHNIDRTLKQHHKVFEMPFTSTTKTHITIAHIPREESFFTLFAKGAPERILGMCDCIFINDIVVPITDEHKATFHEVYANLAQRGHRVLAFAQLVLDAREYPDSSVFSRAAGNIPKHGLVFMGLTSLEDPPKHGVQDAIGRARRAGIKVVMVTGDHPLTAEAVARRINLMLGETKEMIAQRTGRPIQDVSDYEATAIVVHGDQLPHLSDEDWDMIFNKEEIIFARTSPKDKLDIVKRAQALGHIVGVTGDGINDSPALKKADLGISMNHTASDVSRESAGMILLDDHFPSIIRGIAEGRLIFINLKKSIQYAVTHIIPEVIPYILFAVLPMPPTLTPIQVLMIDLGFELMASLSFAFEPPESASELMLAMPRRPVTPASTAALRRALAEEQVKVLYRDELRRMMSLEYWRQLSRPPLGGEILVDADVLLWSYVEGGLIQCTGCLVTFFMVFHTFGMDPLTVIKAQRAGHHFLPHSEPLVVPGSNITIASSFGDFVAVSAATADIYSCLLYLLFSQSGEAQYEALKQSQSAYYLSVLIIQIWNLFACKARHGMPWGWHMIQNAATWYSIGGGLAFGLIVVYVPVFNGIFQTSANLDPRLMLIPFCFGDRFELSYECVQDMDDDDFEWAFELVKRNMLAMYQQTRDMPWSDSSKRREMREEHARFMILRERSAAAGSNEGLGESSGRHRAGRRCGFVYFQFSMDDDELDAKSGEQTRIAVLYIYEMQIEPEMRRQGLGSTLLCTVEALAQKYRMRKCKLTVFKFNDAAMAFYRGAGFVVDVTSPSQYTTPQRASRISYEIMSKTLEAAPRQRQQQTSPESQSGGDEH